MRAQPPTIPTRAAATTCRRASSTAGPSGRPKSFTAHGKTYYFVIFSSARKYKDEFSQQFQLPVATGARLQGAQRFVAALARGHGRRQGDGQVASYPALYIWNQNRPGERRSGKGIQFSNLTPAWDPFKLPPIVIPVVPPDDIAR